MGTTAAPKKKRVSKKSKLSWRKHVDIRDVENYLEDQRLIERLGKPVSEKTDDELFHIDTVATVKQTVTSKQARRLKIQNSLPKCYSMLQPHTQVADPVIKRNHVRTKEERKNKLIKLREEDMRKRGIFKAKELQSLKDKRSYEAKRNNKVKAEECINDIWEVDGTSNLLQFDSWVGNDTKQHTLQGVGRMPKATPKSVTRRNSILPPVEVPHPGTSYNPSFKDHQKLLQNVVEKENKIIHQEKHLKRVTSGMFKKVTQEERDNSWLVEMSEGLENKEENAEDQDTGEYKSINPPVINKKKDLKQRRKLKEQKELEKTRLLAKKEKKKVADIYKLRLFKQQMEKTDKKAEATKILREKQKEKRTKQAKRLGPLKFEEEEFDFNMPQDISGNLRSVKKEGNLLLNRFKSLQKRNILQPTTMRTHKQAKVKRFKKPGHKEDWKTTVSRANN